MSIGGEPRILRSVSGRKSGAADGSEDAAEQIHSQEKTAEMPEDVAFKELIEEGARETERVRESLNDQEKLIFQSILDDTHTSYVVEGSGPHEKDPDPDQTFCVIPDGKGGTFTIPDTGFFSVYSYKANKVAELYARRILEIEKSIMADIEERLLSILRDSAGRGHSDPSHSELFVLQQREGPLHTWGGGDALRWNSTPREIETDKLYASKDVQTAVQSAREWGAEIRRVREAAIAYLTKLVEEYASFPAHRESHADSQNTFSKDSKYGNKAIFALPSGEHLPPTDGVYPGSKEIAWRFAPLNALNLAVHNGEDSRSARVELPRDSVTDGQRGAFLKFAQEAADAISTSNPTRTGRDLLEGDLAIPNVETTLRTLLGGADAMGGDEEKTSGRIQAVRDVLIKENLLESGYDIDLPWSKLASDAGMPVQWDYKVEDRLLAMKQIEKIPDMMGFKNAELILRLPAGNDGVAEIIRATSGSGKTKYLHVRWKPRGAEEAQVRSTTPAASVADLRAALAKKFEKK
jgi:hypothetical protein